MEEWVTLMKVVGEDPEDKRVDAVFMCTDQGGGASWRGGGQTGEGWLLWQGEWRESARLCAELLWPMSY